MAGEGSCARAMTGRRHTATRMAQSRFTVPLHFPTHSAAQPDLLASVYETSTSDVAPVGEVAPRSATQTPKCDWSSTDGEWHRKPNQEDYRFHAPGVNENRCEESRSSPDAWQCARPSSPRLAQPLCGCLARFVVLVVLRWIPDHYGRGPSKASRKRLKDLQP